MNDLNIIGIGLRCNNVTSNIIDGKETIIMKNDNDGDSIHIEDDKLVYATRSGIEVFMKSTHPCYKELRDMAMGELNKTLISQLDKVLDGSLSVTYILDAKDITIGKIRVHYDEHVRDILFEKLPRFKDVVTAVENGKLDDYISYEDKDKSFNLDNNFIHLGYSNGILSKAFAFILIDGNIHVYDVIRTREGYDIYNKYISNNFIKHLRVESMKDISEEGFSFTYKNIKYKVIFSDDSDYITINIKDGKHKEYEFTIFDNELYGQYVFNMYHMAKYIDKIEKGGEVEDMK